MGLFILKENQRELSLLAQTFKLVCASFPVNACNKQAYQPYVSRRIASKGYTMTTDTECCFTAGGANIGQIANTF